MIPVSKPYIGEAEKQAVMEVLDSGMLAQGPRTAKFEERFAQLCGVKHAIATSSGTTALHLALLAHGIGPGDEVITTSFTFIASVNSILFTGATPVFVDIDADTFNLDPELVERAITPRTKAILPVHLYGYVCDMDALQAIADKHSLKIIEDACQAHGAEYKNRKAGSIGDIGCFSFYSTKNMIVCGDGGMVTTNDKNVAEIIRKLRDCGRKSSYEHDVIGYTARLNTVNAAIGIEQLKKLDGWIKKRRENAEFYRRLLSNIEEITLPVPEKDIKSVYHLFVIRAKRRDKLKEFLKKNEIFCGIHYQIPIHLQPIYRELYKYKGGEFPESEKHAEKCLSLPMFPDLKKNEIEYVCDRIKEFYG